MFIEEKGVLSHAEELGHNSSFQRRWKTSVYGYSQSQQDCAVDGGRPSRKEVTVT
jgi:hypothetical protein